MFQHMTIRRQVAFGLGLLLSILVGTIATTAWSVRALQELVAYNVEVHTPTVVAQGQLLSGLSQSIAELRGYLILEDEQFKASRAQSWVAQIRPAIAQLDLLSRSWTRPERLQQLQEVRSLLSGLDTAQDQVERLAHTAADAPGRTSLAERIRPLVDRTLEALQDLDSQVKGSGAQDLALVRLIAAVRATLGLAVSDLEAYVAYGEAPLRERYERRRAILAQQSAELTRAGELFSGTQREALERFTQLKGELAEAADDLVRRSGERGVLSRAEQLLESDALPRAQQIRSLLGELHASETALLKSDQAGIQALIARLLLLQWILLGIGVLGAALVATYIGRTIARRISTETNELKTASSELRTASTQLLSGSSEQATGTSEFATTIRELASAAAQIVERCRQMAEQSEEAVKRCQDGSAAVREAQEVTDAIKAQIEKIVQHMLDLGGRSQEINLAADVITELAEQTTILSYNAAIEAASAGEAGQSFSVVAEQVGKLSDRAKHAVGDVRSLIEEIQRSSNTTIMATEDGLKAADRGRAIQAQASEKMQLILEDIQQTLESTQEIEMSATQQSSAAEQVKDGIQNLASAAKQFELSAQQCLEMAEGIARSAANLDSI